MLRKKLMIPVVAAAMASGLVLSPLSAALAQSQTGTTPVTLEDRGRMGGALVCSTNSPVSVVAKTLGLSDAELRKALVSGKTVSQLAQEKGVDVATISTALQTYYTDEVNKAIADGLLPADAASQTTNDQNRVDGLLNNDSGKGHGFLFAHNEVYEYVVAAEALEMTCPELVKATQSGTTIAEVATQQGKDAQVVIDALVAAHKTALQADVSEGLITQTQADGDLARHTDSVTRFVNAGLSGKGGHGGMDNMDGMRGGRGDRGGNPNTDDSAQGDQGNASDSQSTPSATPAAQ